MIGSGGGKTPREYRRPSPHLTTKEGTMVSVSEKSWGDYKAADYTPEQWHAACLIHQHEGAPTSKGQCKIPVRTPDGTLSRGGVHAAAGALAGARGGVNASPAELASAKKAVVRLYGQLDEEAPPSMTHADLEGFLAHFGTKGMKWGIRKNIDNNGRSTVGPSAEAVKAHNATTDVLVKGIKSATNEAHVEDVIDRAYLNGFVENNIKIANVDVSPNRKNIRYEIKAYRMTPGKLNQSVETGVKVEYITKEVPRLKPGYGLSRADEEVEHMTMKMETEDFLAHYGVTLESDTSNKNTTAVIVALPSALDPIRLVGDEDKHATLLFFGETATLPPGAKEVLIETLALASTVFRPFSEEMVETSRLGSDNPPALVSKLSNGKLGPIRDVLQVNPEIGKYVGNATQYPSYTPHVTLGYPDFQGEAELRELIKPLYSVQFDRLALWWNDEHFEFDLGKSRDDIASNPGEEVKHMTMKMETEDFLAHFGVKGMKWGVIRDRINAPGSLSRSAVNTPQGRARAQAAVARGNPSTKQAHLASLKSTGHRAINGLSGDKTFWRRMAITAGIATTTLAVPVAGAWFLPAGALAALGSSAIGTALAGGPHITMTALEMGQWALGSVGVYGTSGVLAGGTVANIVGNTGRAAAGNALINRSYERVGKTLVDRQSAGRKLVVKALKTVGGIRDKDLKHEGMLETVLAHKERTLQDIFNEMTAEQKDLQAIIVGAALSGDDLSDVPEVAQQYIALSMEQKNFIDFIVGNILSEEKLKHSDDDSLNNFLAHFGVKGMRWGVRRSDRELGSGSGQKSGEDKPGKNNASARSMANMKSGSVVTMVDNEGNPKTMVKKKDGSWQETMLSADAERVVRTGQKEGHEMSTREIQEAINRANFIKSYDAMFSSNPNAALQAKVNELKLRKEMQELTPQKKSKIGALVAGTATAYTAYSQLDKVLGGELSKSLGKKFSDTLDPTAAAAKLAKEAYKDSYALSKDRLDASKAEASVKKAVADAQKASTEASAAVWKLKNSKAEASVKKASKESAKSEEKKASKESVKPEEKKDSSTTQILKWP